MEPEQTIVKIGLVIYGVIVFSALFLYIIKLMKTIIKELEENNKNYKQR